MVTVSLTASMEVTGVPSNHTQTHTHTLMKVHTRKRDSGIRAGILAWEAARRLVTLSQGWVGKAEVMDLGYFGSIYI